METQKSNQIQPLMPLFPLGVVLLPQMIMPLHIFEERYKVMINECIERNIPFGIVYFEGKEMQKVGCTAKVIKVSKRYEDGRMDILAEGEKRFYIEHIDESKPFLQSGILYIDDMDEAKTDEDDTLLEQAFNLLKNLDEVSGFQRDYDFLADLNLKQMSFLIPGSEGFTMEERQQFLEMTSAPERLRKGLQVLKKAIQRAKINLEVKEIIGGNGHIKAFLAEKGLRF